MDVVNKFNRTFIFMVTASVGLTLFSACNSKMNSEIIVKNPNSTTVQKTEKSEKPVVVQKPQPMVSTTSEFDNLPEEAKEEYEAPAKVIKVKDYEILRGETKFTDIVYEANEKTVKITGKLQLKKQIEAISPDDIFNFELKGTIDGANRQIIIKAYDVDNRKTRVRVGARIICLNLTEKSEVDCSQAVVDFIVQIKETKLTDQFKTIPQPKPEEPVVPTPPVADDNDDDDDAQVTPSEPGTVAPPKVAKEPMQVAEGPDSSLRGGINTHVDSDDDIDNILTEDLPSPLLPPKEDDKDKTDPIKPKPKVIKDGLLVTGDGILRPIDQAVNSPGGGHLVQATNLILQQKQLKEEKFYFIAHPERDKSYGTFEAGLLLSKLGQFTSKTFAKRLAVGNMSLPKGGKSPPHVSHQNGTDADVGYPTDEDGVWFPTVVEFLKPKKGATEPIRKFQPNQYSPEKTLELLQYAFTQNEVPIDRIFMDQYIIDDLCQHAKRSHLFDPASSDAQWTEKNEFWKKVFRAIQHVSGHGDHMHIRIKCGSLQRTCEPQIYRKMTHCQS